MEKKKQSVAALMVKFEEYLEKVRWVSSKKRCYYAAYVRAFLEFKAPGGKLDPADILPEDLSAFVVDRASHYKPGTCQQVAVALRNLIRFLHLWDLCELRLLHAVPTVSNRRTQDLPEGLSDGQLKELLDSFDRSTPIGLRDYGVVRCMEGLGLRVSEVARMSLDDIDWRAGTLRLPRTKSRRADILPLPDTIGRALVAYLRSGRPATSERQVFVRHSRPIGSKISTQAFKGIVIRAFKRARIDVPRGGSHTLRRTAATRMVRRGVSLKEIADVLRHRDINTTAIYAKLDLPALSDVAMPWPEVQS